MHLERRKEITGNDNKWTSFCRTRKMVVLTLCHFLFFKSKRFQDLFSLFTQQLLNSDFFPVPWSDSAELILTNDISASRPQLPFTKNKTIITNFLMMDQSVIETLVMLIMIMLILSEFQLQCSLRTCLLGRHVANIDPITLIWKLSLLHPFLSPLGTLSLVRRLVCLSAKTFTLFSALL